MCSPGIEPRTVATTALTSHGTVPLIKSDNLGADLELKVGVLTARYLVLVNIGVSRPAIIEVLTIQTHSQTQKLTIVLFIHYRLKQNQGEQNYVTFRRFYSQRSAKYHINVLTRGITKNL
jgi:hypothetical protein